MKAHLQSRKGKGYRKGIILFNLKQEEYIKPYFVPQFIETSYACLENKGMHKACLDVQKAMKHYHISFIQRIFLFHFILY